MNNNIEENYCSFEVSSAIWKKEGRLKSDKNFTYSNSHPNGTGWYEDLNNSHLSISRPTHSLAIKWIRENFGIHISSYYSATDESWGNEIIDLNKLKQEIKPYAGNTDGFNSPEEAIDTGLLYTLKNLI